MVEEVQLEHMLITGLSLKQISGLMGRDMDSADGPRILTKTKPEQSDLI